MTGSSRVREYLRLILADGVGSKTFAKMIQAFGDVSSAIDIGPAGWKRVDGIGPKKLQALMDVTEAMIDDELAEVAARGARVLCMEDPEYPPALKTIYDPPPVLFIRGRLDRQDAVGMGIVGSRRCTHYGSEQAHRFGGLLARAGFAVISGGARGIDTAAHRGAIAHSGRTVAVMGCGLNACFPSENEELFERIVADDCGALLSELPMRTAVLAGNFPTRNRIISGMSLGTLVVEAALPSGAMITAREAAEQGREVFALPGHVDSPCSAGTHQLLRDGAHLTVDLDDILNALGDVGESVREEEEKTEALPAPTNLTETEQALYDALEAGERSLDELVRDTALPVGSAAAAMTMLSLKGTILQKPGNVFVRKR